MAAATCTPQSAEVPSKTAIRKRYGACELSEELASESLAWLQLQRTNIMGQFAAYMVHEAIQPLTAICNYSSGWLAMNSKCPLATKELCDVLTDINQEAHRASTLVKQLGKNSNLNLEEPTLVDVNSLIRKRLQLISAFLRAEHVEVSTDLSDSPPLVLTNPDGLEQVLLNLIKNAADAMRTLPSKSRSVVISTRKALGSVQIAILDSGPCISDEVFANLSSPFFTTKAASLGLGLWASKNILRQNGGELLFQRMVPQGLAVTVRMPSEKH